MPVVLPSIDDSGLYTQEEACLIIPSRHGKPLHYTTIRNWIREGKITARKIAGTVFIEGREIRRILEGE
jgi:hypothetical protein